MKTFIVIILQLTFLAALSGQTIHAFIAADTEDESIGSGVNEDLKNVEILVKTIAAATGLSYKITFFTPENGFSKKRLSSSDILTSLKQLRVTENDIIIFHYSGHGMSSRTRQDNFPRMYLGSEIENHLELTKVRDIIKEKGARFSLILGDMCNTYYDSRMPKTIVMSVAETRLPPVSQENFKKLFMGVRGDITVCSSQRGELSFSNTRYGGFFTNAYISALTSVVEGKHSSVDWNTVFEETSKLEYASIKRRPYYEINIEPLSVGGSAQTEISDDPFQGDRITAKDILFGLIDGSKSQLERINMQEQVLNSAFDSPDVKVEIVGRNGKTLLDRISSRDYVSRIATVQGLSRLSIVDEQKSASGKFTYIKIHEIYIQ